MDAVIGEVVPLATGIALSPVPVVPAIFLLFTPRPRAAAGMFLAGWVAGILAVASALAALAVFVEAHEETPTWASWAKTGLGTVLLLAAVRQWRSGAANGTPGWMRTLTDATPAKALRLGVLLSGVNPKVVLMSAAAGLAIGAAELGSLRTVASVAVFTALSATTVALPLLLHLAAGERVLVPLGRVRTWLELHNGAVTAVVLAVIGVLLVLDGVSGL
ncbi:GAP family protein [Streptomyces sp. XY431]|uniref:GAP family protein n=1 Tax=Streptomyces sp. XY431 TaxID=1415562 RepID=UPI0006AFE45F|nr:GAP family protein [Streptomyces sp. XY431]